MTIDTSSERDLQGVLHRDFLAIGLGGTGMMSMLWAVAMGRRAVGIEMRGDPFLGVHWNVRADFFHQLGLIDKLMLARYGEDRIPRRGQSDRPFRLAEALFSPHTRSGDIVADEIIEGFDMEQHVVGTIHHIEFIDDRWRDGVPHRTVTLLTPPLPPAQPDDALIRTNMLDVLDGPSTFQGGAASILVLLRRYLEKMEQLDLDGGYEPRVRLFTRHRVLNTPDGFVKLEDGRVGFRIEELQELDFRGKFVRVRRPGSTVIDVGVPDLFMIAEGFRSTDAERLGFTQHDVAVDHHDGRGPVVAQADFLAGLIEVLVGGRLRRRISSEFDDQGTEFWVRQIAVGHEDDPEVGWCLVQVPDFTSFDPIKAGLVPEGTDTQSPEYFAAYNTLVYDFYTQHVGDILELPKEAVSKIQMAYGPKLFTLVERMGDDALLAPNGVVAGDSFGNGHFLTSGGAMTGMVGHSWRVYEYFQARDAGVPHDTAIRQLADHIKEDTRSWLHVSAKEYSEAVPINFGAERIAQIEAQSGISSSARAATIDASRRQRHSLLPLDPSDWRRLFLRNGMVYSAPLPELHAMHPALRSQRPRKNGSRITAALVAPDLDATTLRYLQGALAQPGVTLGLVTQASVEELPDRMRDRLAAVARISDVCDAAQIHDALRGMSDYLGTPERLFGTAGKVQRAVAEVRTQLGIDGMNVDRVRDLTSISRARSKLEQAGIPVARYAVVESVEDGMAFATEVGYFPLVVKPDDAAQATDPASIHRVDSDDALRALLERLQPNQARRLICEEFVRGQACTLEVITIGGIPAWFSATRSAPDDPNEVLTPRLPVTITLPREADDPADPLLRRMGFAALKALGIDTGLSSIDWVRQPDNTPIITSVSASPPMDDIMSLMALAHDADMYRVWGNSAINGVFAPIPRLYAAGAVYYPQPDESAAGSLAHDLEAMQRELGKVVVKVETPEAGHARWQILGSVGCALVSHPETAVVDEVLKRIAVTMAGQQTAMASASQTLTPRFEARPPA